MILFAQIWSVSPDSFFSFVEIYYQCQYIKRYPSLLSQSRWILKISLPSMCIGPSCVMALFVCTLSMCLVMLLSLIFRSWLSYNNQNNAMNNWSCKHKSHQPTYSEDFYHCTQSNGHLWYLRWIKKDKLCIIRERR